MDVEQHFRENDSVEVKEELHGNTWSGSVEETWKVPFLIQILTYHHQLVKVQGIWVSGYWLSKVS